MRTALREPACAWGDRLATLQSLGAPAPVAVFAASAAIIWVAGVRLSDATDILSRRFGAGKGRIS
jgi:hypothetical protein